MQGLSTWETVFAIAVFVILAWVIGWRLVLALRSVEQGDDARQDVVALLGRAASKMATQPPEQQAEDIVYVLESLSYHVDKATYRHVLEVVQGYIGSQLVAKS